jgi:hypothetical protein
MDDYRKTASAALRGLSAETVAYFARAWNYAECDLSDNWVDECDPDNEQGAYVVGYFSTDNNEGYIEARLEGISVERMGLPMAYFDRAAVTMLWGKDTINRIDADQSDIENELARAWV